MSIFLNFFEKIKVSLKLDKIVGTLHEDLRAFMINISLNSSQSEKVFRQTLYRKSKHTFIQFFFFSKIIAFVR